MRITAYSYTNKGGREHNEDSIRQRLEEDRGVFVVADGLGGHDCGEVASALAADAIAGGCDLDAAPDRERLLELLDTANSKVMEGQKMSGQEEMKTTAVTLHLSRDKAAWAHIGDSRLYHFSRGQLAHITRDHSVTYMKYLGGEISSMDIYHDDDRSSLLRVLGREPCQAEAGQCEVQPGDAFLLCTDGFWEFVYTEEVLIDLLKSRTPEEWAEHMLLRHIRRTPEGNDNFSLITVFVEE